MQQLLPNSHKASHRDEAGSRWTLPNLSGGEKIVNIVAQVQPAYRVLIVDRDSMSSDLLANALFRDRECQAVAIPSADLLRTLSTSEVDLLIIAADLDSKPGSGYDLAHTVSRMYSSTCIVVLLNQTSHEAVINAFRAGARGVFSRQQPMVDFLDCVDHVRKGYIWAGKDETDSLLQAFKSLPAPNLVTAPDSPTLTTREMQVVQCAAKGKTNRVIASDLGLSEHTVKNYLFRAFEKLGVSSRVELLFYLTLRGHTFGPAKTDDAGMDFDIE